MYMYMQGEIVRPSAVRAYFASRACRSVHGTEYSSYIIPLHFHRTSIMIGTALKVSEMSKVMLFSTALNVFTIHSKIYTAAY